MNWTAIHNWLYTGSILGIHRVAWAGLTALALLELVLGRSKNPQLRSLASAVALAMQKVLELTRISMIPIAGPLVVNVLKIVDGDTSVPPAPAAAKLPPLDPPPPAA